MQMDLGEVDGCDGEKCEFTVTKVEEDAWKGCPFELGTMTTALLFKHVRSCLEGEDFIKVSHGKDPRRVKKEFVEQVCVPCHLMSYDHAWMPLIFTCIDPIKSMH